MAALALVSTAVILSLCKEMYSMYLTEKNSEVIQMCLNILIFPRHHLEDSFKTLMLRKGGLMN